MAAANGYRNLRVLDLSENIAGPLACMIFGDLGADVVKVERLAGGDATRPLPPHYRGTGTVFWTLNRNKRSVALDLKTPLGRQAALQIAATADVVVESFRPSVADRLGVGFDDVLGVKPDVIYCSISAFGRGNLGAQLPGYDALVQAFTGIMALTGSPAGPPARTAPSVLDITTGMWAAMSIMAALADRRPGCGGLHVDASLIDSGLFLMCHQIVGLLAADYHPQRLGSAAPSAAPYQEFATQDGSLIVAAITDRLFVKLCQVIGAEYLGVDQRFGSAQSRVAHRDVLATHLQRIFASRPTSHWLQHLAEAGIPASPVHSLEQAVADPLTYERALITTAAGHLPQVRLPLDQDRDFPMSAPPELGEHTAEVLRDVGLSDELLGKILEEHTASTQNGTR